jgi:hypothetical protein
MTHTIIFHSDRFDVVSYGNGLSYAVHDNINKRSMFVHGDDATQFRKELEAFEIADPEKPYDDFYAEQLAIRE